MTDQTDTDALAKEVRRAAVELLAGDAAISVYKAATYITTPAAQIAALTKRVRVLEDMVEDCADTLEQVLDDFQDGLSVCPFVKDEVRFRAAEARTALASKDPNQ